MSVPNHSLVNWPAESGFFTPANTMSHYFMLKEKFQALEHQLKRLEQVPSAKFKDPYHKKTKNIELQLYMLKASLESIRALLQKGELTLTGFETLSEFIYCPIGDIHLNQVFT